MKTKMITMCRWDDKKCEFVEVAQSDGVVLKVGDRTFEFVAAGEGMALKCDAPWVLRIVPVTRQMVELEMMRGGRT